MSYQAFDHAPLEQVREMVAGSDELRANLCVAAHLALDETPMPDFKQGLDFYQEVSRFEITLIRRALMFTEGHQGKAARLLNLNATTLSLNNEA